MRKTLSFLFVVFFLPGLTNCGGKQRPFSPTDNTPNEEDATTPANEVAKVNTATKGAVDQAKGKAAPTTNTPVAGNTPPSVPAVTFKDVKPLFQNYCISCHGVQYFRLNEAGSPNPNDPLPPFILTKYSVAKEYVDNGKLLERIWTLRNDPIRRMPWNIEMPDEDRQKIKDWIDAGAPK